MKTKLVLALFALFALVLAGCGSTGEDQAKESTPEATAEQEMAAETAPVTEEASAVPPRPVVAEIACGHCVYKMEGLESCQPAVKIGDNTYLLTGFEVDMAANDLCTAPRKAAVVGRVEGKQFVASDVKITPKNP